MENIFIKHVKNCNYENIKKWLNLGVNPNYDKNGAIVTAASIGHINIVDLLLKDDRVNPSAQCNNAIVLAAYNGHIEIVKLLLTNNRIDPSDGNNQTIHWADFYNKIGKTNIVKLLLTDIRVVNKLSIKDKIKYNLVKFNGKKETNKKCCILFRKPTIGEKYYEIQESDTLNSFIVIAKWFNNFDYSGNIRSVECYEQNKN